MASQHGYAVVHYQENLLVKLSPLSSNQAALSEVPDKTRFGACSGRVGTGAPKTEAPMRGSEPPPRSFLMKGNNPARRRVSRFFQMPKDRRCGGGDHLCRSMNRTSVLLIRRCKSRPGKNMVHFELSPKARADGATCYSIGGSKINNQHSRIPRTETSFTRTINRTEQSHFNRSNATAQVFSHNSQTSQGASIWSSTT